MIINSDTKQQVTLENLTPSTGLTGKYFSIDRSNVTISSNQIIYNDTTFASKLANALRNYNIRLTLTLEVPTGTILNSSSTIFTLWCKWGNYSYGSGAPNGEIFAQFKTGDIYTETSTYYPGYDNIIYNEFYFKGMGLEGDNWLMYYPYPINRVLHLQGGNSSYSIRRISYNFLNNANTQNTGLLNLFCYYYLKNRDLGKLTITTQNFNLYTSVKPSIEVFCYS